MAWNAPQKAVLKTSSCTRCLGSEGRTAGSAGPHGSRGLWDKLCSLIFFVNIQL